MVENFGIYYEDTFLDVEPGEMLTVEWVSSFFNEDRIFAGSYTYPVLLSPTEKNYAKLGNPQLLENRFSRKRIPVLIHLFGQSWKRGELQYDVTPSGLEASILIDVGVVAEWMRERSVASVFTVSNNGRFVKFIDLMGKGSESANKAWVVDSQMAAPGVMPFVFAPIRNDIATGDMIGDENAPYNMWLVNPCIDGVNDFGDTVWTPFFYLHWVIREVCSFLGFEARGSFLDDVESRQWVVYNTGVFHADEFKKSTFAIQPAKHLPDLSISDLMKLLRNDYQVRIYFDSNSREAYFLLADDLLQTNTIMDLSGMLVRDSLNVKYNSVQGYELLAKIDDGDEIPTLFPYVRKFSIGSSNTPKAQELKSAITYMYSGLVSNGKQVRCPWVRQQPNLYGELFVDKSDYNAENTYGKNGFGFRVLAYKGRLSNTKGSSNLYPYMTADDRNPNGVESYVSSVAPGGQTGFLNRYCQGWYNMLTASEQLDFRVNMWLKNFLDLSPLHRVLVSTESFARTALLLDRVTFEPSPDSGRIDARVLGYGQYNIMAIENNAEVIFEDGDVVVPEVKVYARLVHKPSMDGFYTINKSKEKEKHVYLWVYFYRDAAGTIPYSVTNMNVYYEGHETSPKGTNEVRNHGPVKVTGTEGYLGEQMCYRWVKSTLWNGWTGTERTQTFRLLENGNAYIII